MGPAESASNNSYHAGRGGTEGLGDDIETGVSDVAIYSPPQAAFELVADGDRSAMASRRAVPA